MCRRRALSSLILLLWATTAGLTNTSHAAESENISFDIEAQPLELALERFADQSRRMVSANPSLLDGRRSPTIRGIMQPQQALLQMTANTGLMVVALETGDFAIRSAAESPNVTNSETPQRWIDEIVVRGTKQFFSLQDTQTSVAVLSAEELERRALFNVQDVLLRTPNVSGASANNLNTLAIRGVSLLGVGLAGSGNTSNVYIDNHPNSFAANRISTNLWDIEQIEVLRGPQSTVQGRNALAGAIVISTADPEYDFGTAIRAMGGNEDHRQYSGMVTGPIITDQLAYRLSADYREFDFGVTNPATGSSTMFEEALTVRGKLLIEPEFLPDLRVELIGQYVDAESGNPIGVTAPVPVTDPAFSEFDPFGNENFSPFEWFEFVEQKRFTLEAAYDLSDAWQLTVIATLEDTDRTTERGGPTDYTIEGETLETRLSFNYDKASGWIGAYYFKEEESNSTVFLSDPIDFGLPTDPSGSIVTLTSLSGFDIENYALFGEFQFELSERWTVNVGARYDREERFNSADSGSVTADPASCVFSAAAGSFAGLPCITLFSGFVPNGEVSEADFSAFLPKASFIYQVDEWRSMSLNVARGYRAGGVFRRIISATDSTFEEFDPEFLTNYEIALRSEWPETTLVVNANLFYSDWDDQQVVIPGSSGFPLDAVTVNAGTSEMYGAEITASKVLSDEVSIFAGLGILHTEFTDFPYSIDANGNPINLADPRFANLAGNEFNNAPEVTFNLGIDYESTNGLFANANLSYASRVYSDVFNLRENEGDSYTLVNVRLGYRQDFWEIALFADNVLDERFVIEQQLFDVTDSTGAVSPAGRPFFQVNEPRLVGVELKLAI